jgi:hypothetical protein
MTGMIRHRLTNSCKGGDTTRRVTGHDSLKSSLPTRCATVNIHSNIPRFSRKVGEVLGELEATSLVGASMKGNQLYAWVPVEYCTVQ